MATVSAAGSNTMLHLAAGRLPSRELWQPGVLLDHGLCEQRNCMQLAVPSDVVGVGLGRVKSSVLGDRTSASVLGTSGSEIFSCSGSNFPSSSGRFRPCVGPAGADGSVRGSGVRTARNRCWQSAGGRHSNETGRGSAYKVQEASMLDRSCPWGRKLPVSWSQEAFPDACQVSQGYRFADNVQCRAGYQERGTGFGRLSSVINLDEYMVTLEKPIGIRFAQTLTGDVFVEALASKGNAANSQMIMVGDILKKTSAVFGDAMWDVSDFARTMHALKMRSGPVSLVFERSPAPLQLQPVMNSTKEILFNSGRVAVSTWNPLNMVSAYQPDSEDSLAGGNVGFVVFSSKPLMPRALKAMAHMMGGGGTAVLSDAEESHVESKGWSGGDHQFEIIASFSDEDESEEEPEWTHGNFSLEEYNKALARARYDLTYNHRQGMSYSKVTEQIFVGSCIQSETDVHHLGQSLGVTAILNLQRKSSFVNWSVDGEAIETTAEKEGLVYVQFPIRDVDSFDLRRKLPFAVGILYRLLRQGHKVYVTCTTGLEHSPACVISYLHWIQDVALEDAVEFVNNVRPCGVDLPALVWATWDIIAMVEKENHTGPPTHSVQFVWNHGCKEGEEVLLVGDFLGGWNEPVSAVHVSGPKYTVDLRLPQGKYLYKFIVGGQWRHSNSLPNESDRWGNVNNVIKIGGEATTRFDTPTRGGVKELTSIKVIQRPLTEDERFMLAFGARHAILFYPSDGVAGIFEGSDILYSAVAGTEITEVSSPNQEADQDGDIEELLLMSTGADAQVITGYPAQVITGYPQVTDEYGEFTP